MEMMPGMSMQNVTRGRLVPYCVVTGLVPVQKQADEYMQRYAAAGFRDQRRDMPLWSDYLVERSVVAPGGRENWERIDVKSFLKTAQRDWAGIQSEQLPPGFVLPPEQNPGATIGYSTPLPLLAGEPWGSEALHPWFLEQIKKTIAEQAETARQAAEAGTPVLGQNPAAGPEFQSPLQGSPLGNPEFGPGPGMMPMGGNGGGISAQPPQAPQGVAAVQSNLPKSYAHGGILHFENGGEAAMRQQVGDVSQLSDSAEEVQQVLRDLQSGKLQGAERQAALGYLQDIANKSAGGGRGFVNPGMEMPTKQLANQGLDLISKAPSQDRVILNPQEEAFKNQAMNMLSSRMSIDPEAARAAEEARMKAATGEHFNQAQQAKQEGLAALKTLYAKDQAGRPDSFWQTLSAIGAKGPNVLPGQWGAGVAEKVQGENEAYNALDIARQTNINNLNESIQNAILNNDLGIYKAGKDEFTRAENQIGTSSQAAATMADAILRWKTSDADRMARIASEEKIRGDALSQAKDLAASKRMLDATAAADKAAMNDEEVKAYLAKVKSGMMLPAEQQAAERRIEQIKQAYTERYLRAIGAPVPVAQATTSSNRMKFDAQGNPI
jgi:hypothetical protein